MKTSQTLSNIRITDSVMTLQEKKDCRLKAVESRAQSESVCHPWYISQNPTNPPTSLPDTTQCLNCQKGNTDLLGRMLKLSILVKIILIACSSAEAGWEWQYDMNSPTSENLISGQRQKKMSWGNQSCSMSRLLQRPQRYQHRRSDLFYKWSGMDSLFLNDYLGLLSRPLNGNNKCSGPYPLF